MKNPKFLPIVFDPKNGVFQNIDRLNEVSELLYRYHSKLFDDFAGWTRTTALQKTICLIQEYAPAFWAVIDPKTGELAGVAYLYDWRGDCRFNFCAFVSTCFKRKYWGAFARRAGKLFIRYVSQKYRLLSLRAEVFDDNLLAQRYLNTLGFSLCGVNRFQTMCGGRITDTRIFGRAPCERSEPSP